MVPSFCHWQKATGASRIVYLLLLIACKRKLDMVQDCKWIAYASGTDGSGITQAGRRQRLHAAHAPEL